MGMDDRRINRFTYEHQGSGQQYQLVGILDRGAGALLDFLSVTILSVAGILGAALLMHFTTGSGGLFALLSKVALVLSGPVYFLFCWHLWGKTPGMRAVNAELVDARTFERPLWWRLALRYLVFAALIVVLGGYAFLLLAVWMAVDKRKQGLHDRVAGTLVILRMPLALREDHCDMSDQASDAAT
ncbi:RDD family protein [Pseudomonas sp. WS 5019]|nr:RDD family protein [Pseudomonas sp. WS 5019]NMY16369.1 RDD family protein [Pseudomonas sp. WS 5019]